mgnify:CR=1 FL=1
MKRFNHQELDSVLESLAARSMPTADEKVWVFDSAFRHYERLVGEHGKCERAAIKKSLLDYLLRDCPGLAKSAKALHRDFNRKLKAWRECGRSPQAIADKRPLQSGNFRRPDFAEDSKKVFAEAVLHNGNESLAYRKLRQRGELSQEFCQYHTFDIRKHKSYVPGCVRDEVTPQVEMVLPLHRGPLEAKMKGPHIPRDWSGVMPADYFTADDVTSNHYFWYEDENGLPQTTRGECLLATDLRTGYPLSFLLIAGNSGKVGNSRRSSYNSVHIRSLILSVHDKVGLPHKGLSFERGIWSARLIDGDRRQGEPMPWRETELGLREWGVEMDVRHATTPRAKPIEGWLRILQVRMQTEPGFVGSDEKKVKFERTQDFMARARSGKEHPGNELFSMEQWRDRLIRILEEFASEPQNGKMLPGISPGEAWQDGLGVRPLRQLPHEARYLLATHKEIVTVRQNGIKIRGNYYCSEQTGERIGQRVLAFFNIEQPELLTVSDLNRRNYFAVKRLPEVPAMDATREQFAEVNAQIAAHQKAAKVLYGSILHPVIATITRDTDVAPASMELGRFHNQAVEEHRTEEANTARKIRQARKLAAALGTAAPATAQNVDRVLNGQKRETEMRARLMQQNRPTP